MKKRLTILQRWSSKLPSPTKELRAAYRAAWTDAQCVAWGERTSAKVVLRQATSWIAPAAAALKQGAEVAYSLRRVGFLTELAVELEAEVLGTGTNEADRRDLEAAMARAKKARTRVLQRMAVMVGGDALRAAQYSELSGTPRDASAMVKFLVKAAELLRRWREDALGQALADDVGLDGASVSDLEALASELSDEAEPFLGVPQRAGDAPATNMLEGRVLRELRMLQLAFADARESGQRVPVLRVSTGLKTQLAPQRRPSKKKPKRS